MNKQKKERKAASWCLRLLYVSICLLVLYAFVFILEFLFPYRNTTKIKSKEEMFQFVIEHQEELEQIVKDMEEFYEKSDRRVIFMSRNNFVLEDESVKLDSVKMLYKNFSADRVAARNSEDVFEVQFFFAYVPTGYDYWGIYYRSDDIVHFWDAGGEVQEENGVYTQIGSYYIYETERIIDNWYYYQCNTR